ncbi:RNA-guided endonuclease TnpB family protein [Actinomadura kijaniata]|uniref:Putative transposase n=1 Tax=Actinomadura namibiensis TaxID=182080 RepID=A0A7W3QRS6_ACTNM|nr:RNA-guided endonuclease TnpB family protein [Actinomadura namibiensis]MBA8957100.1 putative transposase [Actinomadura namibiensis]
MQLRYNYRLYPTPAQRTSLGKAFGCARVVYNDGLRVREEARRQGRAISDNELSKLVITQAKRTPERSWLGEVSAVVLQQSLADLCVAYRNFWNSRAGRRGGPSVNPPSPKRRKGRQAIRFTRNARFSITSSGRLSLPKVGNVKIVWSRPLPADPSSVTVVKDAAGRYFASFAVALPALGPLPSTERQVGIDLGLTHFAVLSDGTRIGDPKWLRRRERKLKRAARAFSRTAEGSENRARARTRLARQHARAADARREFHHQLSTWLVRDNQAVHVEDLAVRGLARSRLAKSVHDAGWGRFLAMLEDKARRHGRVFARADRGFASSQICSACGRRDGPKPLKVREWRCPGCGTRHDRDVNAARNVLDEGRRTVAAGRTLARGHAETLNACGAPVRPPFCVARVVEAGTRRKTVE